jgi:hypothetical protein
MTDGGGTRRATGKRAMPHREFPRRHDATATGSRSPIRGAQQASGTERERSCLDGAGATPACSALAVMDTADITGSRNATGAVIAGAGKARAPAIDEPGWPRWIAERPSGALRDDAFGVSSSP